MISVSKPDESQLNEVMQWPTWEKEPSQFVAENADKEMFYFIEGKATLSHAAGDTVTIQAGDLVTVEGGISVDWTVQQQVKKHFKFFK